MTFSASVTSSVCVNIRLALCLLLLSAPLASARDPEPAVPSVIPAPRAEPVVPPSPAKSIATQLNDAFVNVFERVAPAVVIIDVYKRVGSGEGSDFFPEFFFQNPDGGEDGGGGGKSGDGAGKIPPPVKSPDASSAGPRARSQSEGSGFIIQSGGYILTNYHVVAGASTINVRLKDGRQFAAKLVGCDEKTDIAVIKIAAVDLPTAELADSDSVRVGEIACAIGVPYNLDYSFTTGVVSAKGRSKLHVADDDYEDYLQTDASINPGNSGGPLVDLDGKVIGMNTLIHGLNRGLGFSIPSNMLRMVGDELIHSGHVVRSWIGVRIEAAEDAEGRYGSVFSGVKKGVIVTGIQPESPAMRSDALQPADIILDVDGAAVSTEMELQKQILSKKVGATVQLNVLRRKKTLKVAVTTEEMPTPIITQEPENQGAGDDVGGEERRREKAAQSYGMQVQDLTREMAATVGVRFSVGVIVTTVAEDSLASKAGILAKDVITSVDDRPIKDIASFKEAIRASDPKKGVLCVVDRLLGKSFVVIKKD